MAQQTVRTYTFIKNIKGTLVFNLDSYDMQLPRKRFEIPYNVDKIVVPYSYALGLFVSSGAKDMMERGYFKIDDFKSLAKDAVEQGLAAAEDYPDVFDVKKIEEAVKKNDSKKIKSMIDSGDVVVMDNLVTIAKENFQNLNQGVIEMIEKACGVELKVE